MSSEEKRDDGWTMVSVVIPAFQEEECIGDCVREAAEVMRQTGLRFEIVVVDDGSTDGTFDVLRALKGRVAELRAIHFSRNCGQTAAMQAGFSAAVGEVVVTLDADMQNDPRDIPALLEKLHDYDVVCGVRTRREDSLVRRISSRVANGIRNCVTRERITDTGCTLKAYRGKFLRNVRLYEGMHRFLPTLLRMEGARVTEMPVRHRPRLRGKTKYGVWNRAIRGLLDLFAVRWMQSRRIHYDIAEELK